MSREIGESAIVKLSDEPYQGFMMLMYNSLLNSKKFRKKIERIEKEISWFNGMNNSTKRPDYIGFYDHIKKHYFDVDNTSIEPKYKAILDYTYGEEPEVLYFIMLFVKRQNDLDQFMEMYDTENSEKDSKLQKQYHKLFNEMKLLIGLLEKLDKLVLAVINSYDLINLQHLDDSIKELDGVTLKHRFLAAISRKEKNIAFKLLGRLRDLDDGEDCYLEALAHFTNEEYEDAIRFAKKVKPGEIDYPSASAMIMECYAIMGDIKSFNRYMEDIKNKISSSYLIYLLQTLICNLNSEELDDEDLKLSLTSEIDRKLDFKENASLIGKVYRNFVDIALEGIGLVEEILYYATFTEELMIPDKIQFRLSQLSLALNLYPNEDISQYLDVDNVSKKGLDICREEISKWAMITLINKNPDESFQNIYLAFMAQYKLGFVKDFIDNIESNLTSIEMHGINGESQAYDLISLAYIECSISGRNTDKILEVLKRANINIEKNSHEIKSKKILSILSDKGRVAYDAAEWQYNRAIEEDYGWKDAGMLSLAYFRILEVEFNQKIILPLLTIISISELESRFNEHKEKLSGKPLYIYKTKWETLIKEFKNITDPNNHTDGLMLGPLEYFLRNLGSKYDNTDEWSGIG